MDSQGFLQHVFARIHVDAEKTSTIVKSDYYLVCPSVYEYVSH